jgi:hypothetical protein
MPLTFAHPAAVLPFSRNSNYIHFTAMVLGSMAPDFEYFLRGQPGGEIGHTFLGLFYFNLPLVVLIFGIYRYFIYHHFKHHLPMKFQLKVTYKHHPNKWIRKIVFLYSALFGMMTHIVWDSFTHVNGYMVLKLPFLIETLTISGYEVPIFKFLQHGSTLLGLLLITIFFYMQGSTDVDDSITCRHKQIYWSMILLMMVVILSVWSILNFVPFTKYGIWVVRFIDSTFLSLLMVSIFFQRKKTS